jgi:hypothetical protein
MPLERRLIKVGDSRAVILPADWLKYYESKLGRPIETLLMEINDTITIRVEENGEEPKQ